jgi:hypothetical protein
MINITNKTLKLEGIIGTYDPYRLKLLNCAKTYSINVYQRIIEAADTFGTNTDLTLELTNYDGNVNKDIYRGTIHQLLEGSNDPKLFIGNFILQDVFSSFVGHKLSLLFEFKERVESHPIRIDISKETMVASRKVAEAIGKVFQPGSIYSQPKTYDGEWSGELFDKMVRIPW